MVKKLPLMLLDGVMAHGAIKFYSEILVQRFV